MAKNDENLNGQQAAQEAAAGAPSTTPNQDKWRENMRAKYPDAADDEALFEASMRGYDEEHDFAKRQREENDQLARIIQDKPEIAGFYSELASGNIGAAILNIGDLVEAYKSGEMDDEKYNTMVADRKKADEEKNSAIDAQNEVYRQWCEKKGYDPDEWMERANEQLFKPMSTYKMAEAQFDALDKMLNYDEDVEAAEIRGRNANIVAQRKKRSEATDGQANGGSASATTPAQRTKKTIFDVARDAE